MRLTLVRNWWSLVVRGMVAIVAGVIAFAWPGITLLGLVFVFAAYSLLDGILSLVGAIRAAGARERWGALVFEGVVGIAAACVAVGWPGITILALVYVIAAWALVTGVLEIAAAVRLRKYISGEWLLALGGVASIAFGILIAMAPLAGALVIALWFGAYALVFGIIEIALGFRLRTWRNAELPGPQVAAPAH